MAKNAATKRKAQAEQPATEEPKGLTPKEQVFVAAYLKDMNATKAAMAAGFSEASAAVIGHRLLRKVNIAAAVAEAIEQRNQRVETDADYLLRRWREQADADIGDIYDDDGALKPIKQWPLIFRQGLVCGIDVEQLFVGEGEDRKQVGITSKIKLADRLSILQTIGKHTNVQAFAPKKIEVKADQVLTGLYEKIQGNSIRPRDDGTPRT